MKNKITWLIAPLLLLCFSFAQCRKDKDNQKDELPPITQTGANTFGCLVNGKVFIPKGYNGTGTPNPKVRFDVGLNGLPYLQIESEQLNYDHKSEGYIIVSFANITATGIYDLPTFNFLIGWEKVLHNCFTPAFDSSLNKLGSGIITRYDKVDRIISGTFDCKFKGQNCDTVYITQGRFDFKF